MPTTLKKRLLRVVVLLVVLCAILIVGLMVRGDPRSFTVTVAEISLPEPLSTFDNPGRLMLIRGALAGPARIAPCPQDVPDAGPKPEPAPCSIRPTAPDRTFELRTTSHSSPFQGLQLSSKPKAPGRTACGVTLRAASEEQDLLAFEWFRTNENCTAQASVVVAQREPSLDAKGLGMDADAGVANADAGVVNADAGVIGKIGRPDRLTSMELPLVPEEPVELGYRAQNGRRLLWESQLALTELTFIAGAPTVFHHQVGWSGIAEGTCEAAPGTKVRVETDAGSPLELSRIDVTAAGLEVSFSVNRGFRIDTGSCKLSSRALEIEGMFVWFLEALVGIGIVSLLLEKAWKGVC